MFDSRRLPTRPIASKDSFEDELDTRFAAHLVAHQLTQSAHVAGRAGLVIDDEVGVLLAHACTAHTRALEAERIDQPACRVVGWIAEERAGRWLAERLVLLPPATDLVETLADELRFSRFELKRGPRDNL